ncbi:TPA: LPXTG cell wall anchor domain-containing protein [Streptococcus agalactiae]|uniref:LPXTG cell wall anchor domain-containing protein n=1 Tax=Streptococcus agalactiae TaxID=1311 RepID=UPI00031B21B7|nr:LPXTG cell wall anchor domain-containing protein [Streptococcus agalactiae]EPU29525.1 fibronectin-binding protein [Streptococcus agalactiae MRI Z1-039]KLK49092.1 cell wall anchor protein [Streptococcus agalactiae]HEN0282240.1 LPXTG cell wall anchor domain-containing protein [Streptococcus agalactiae]HEN0466958.1 LPXTG cell wall anchor domain-containing protein [Streptococcus agalactiae]HEN0553575.1 LPXTG cell wall anchor domain-containing protein [Streptococcus agalactiae]
MFNKIGFRTWKSGKLWLYMGVLGSTIILGSSPVSAMDSVGNQSQGNVLERRQRDADNKSQGNVLERRQRDMENKSQVGQLIEKNPLLSKSTVSRENNHSSQGDSNKQSFSKKVSQVTNVANRPMLTNNSRTIPVINKLPKTGDDQNVIFKLVGFGLILLTSLCGLRRNEN